MTRRAIRRGYVKRLGYKTALNGLAFLKNQIQTGTERNRPRNVFALGGGGEGCFYFLSACPCFQNLRSESELQFARGTTEVDENKPIPQQPQRRPTESQKG